MILKQNLKKMKVATESSWKIMKNTFNFVLTNWVCCWQIRFCTYYAFSLNQLSDIRQVWKYWPLKDDFCSIVQGRHFVVGGPKIVKLLADISFQNSFQITVFAEFTAIFLCLLLSWSRRYSMKWSSNFDGP